MRASSCVRLFGCLVGMLFVNASTCCAAWDVNYDGSVLPTDPSLGANAWQLHDYYAPNDLSKTSAADGLLHIVDEWSDRLVFFTREGEYLAAGSSITVEARLSVLTGYYPHTDLSPVMFGVQVGRGSNAAVYLWPDRVGARYPGVNQFLTVPVDMTEFHTIRLALDSGSYFRIWLDNELLFASATTPGSRGTGLYFTSGVGAYATSDSYWDYVRYSKEYLPVPEPSGLLALAGGVSGMLALSRRRSSAR